MFRNARGTLGTARGVMAVVALCSLAGAAGAIAQVPSYDSFELEARSNFSGAFNLPDAAFFTNNDPSLNDNTEVAIYISVVAGSNAKSVWFGGNGTGGLVYTSPDDAFLGDVSLNNPGQIVFRQEFVSPAGIILYDTATGQDSVAVGPGGPFGLTGWSSPQINDSGQIGFRGDVAFSGQAWISDAAGSQAQHAAEVGVDPQSPYSFLFTPGFNNARQIAGKARVGDAGQFGNDQPDEIRVFNADGSSVLIAEDDDGNPAAPYVSFNNSVGLNDNGAVAFIAGLVGGGEGVFLGDGTSTTTIATTADPNISDIEPFAPDVTNDGLVVFRAFDAAGLRAIWVGDGQSLLRVVTEHDIVPTDLGDARVDQHDSSPVFGGSPDINNNGDVAFHAGLTPPDNNQIEWGSGLFVALATQPLTGDLNCDGVLNAADIDPFVLALTDPAGYAAAFPDCDRTLADVNGDGAVNAGDIDPFVALIVGP